MKIVNPATEEVVAEVEEDSVAQLRSKFNLLRESQTNWHQVPLLQRIQICDRFADLLIQESHHLSLTLTTEVGKPIKQSRNELKGAVSRIHWMTRNAEKYLSTEWMKNEEGSQEKIAYEPLGVVCNISAWNYPYLVGVNVFVPALLAGNSVMYKPSEFSTLTGLEIERLLKKAGVPQDVFQTAIGGPSVGKELLELPFDGVFFTGSYKTGQSIYERCARNMIPCQCELGGKDPLYVADDVHDVKAVAASTADGAFYNNGQSCCAVERIYVHEKIYDHYIDEFVKEVRSWKSGNPADENTYIGPLTRKNQVELLERQISEAIHKGAKVLTGGKRIDSKGYYFEPTVLVDVTHDMSVMREESFGPVIGVMKVRDDDEAVSMMQDTEYGLTASVYSSKKERAENILRQVDVGSGYWNCCDRVSAALPWSGRKHSGFGSTLSHAGLRAFTKPKAYHLIG